MEFGGTQRSSTAIGGTAAGRIYGRERELEEADAFVSAASERSTGLLFVGEPGIGKTALWEAAVAMAEAAGHTVLAARPAEAERGLPYAGLVDLLDRVSLDEIGDLPDPQRGALAAALMREEARGDSLAVSLGLRHVLATLSDAAPVVTAVDDLHWLDQASARALAFALRRLADSRVSLLASVRAGEIANAVTIEPGGIAKRTEIGSVEPLAQASLARMLQKQLGMTLTPPSMSRLAEITGGNPLYALELARALSPGARLAIGEQPDAPAGLLELLTQRLRLLSADALRLVSAAAALARPESEELERVGPGLADAVDAGILVIDAARVRFTHPLLATAALRLLSPHEIQAMHRQLAELVSDPVERALQRALGTPGADAEVAAELEAGASVAAARGAPDAAAELAERAEAATPRSDDDDAARRALLAATHHLTAGDGPRGRVILERLERDLPAGRRRAEALILLAESTQDLTEAGRCLERARREGAADPSIRANAHLTLATLRFLTSDHARAERNAQAAMRLAYAVGDELVHALALSDLAFVRFHRGRGLQRRLSEQAIAVVERFRQTDHSERPERLSQPALDFAIQLFYSDELDAARLIIEKERSRASRLGDLASLASALLHLVEIELRAGNWTEAEAMSDEVLEMSTQMQMTNFQPAALYGRALVDAHIGREEAGRARAIEGREAATAAGDEIFFQASTWALGLLELSLGNGREANEALTAAAATAAKMGLAEGPPIFADAAEAAVIAGSLDLAEDRIELARQSPTTAERISRRAAIARAQALIAAERADLDTALAFTETALRDHERLDEPFQRARTLLVRGGVLRRAGRRSDARLTLTEAETELDRLGAAIWSRRAAAERARIGGRRAGGDELTTTEQRVAELVARGRTNREVAAELFVTPRTVEANLTRIYRKLGVRSRTELASRLSAEAEGSPPG